MVSVLIITEVVYALETFDPLIIRCGIAHYLLCKYIAQTSEVKVLLSGELALFITLDLMGKSITSKKIFAEATVALSSCH